MNRFFLCKGEKESCDHIFHHCSKASLLWQLVFSLFGVVLVLHTSVQLSKQCFLVSIIDPLGRGERRREMLFLFVCFGLLGKREIKGLLIILSFQIKS